MMDEEFNEVGEDAVNVPPYWPPDQAMRLECLRLAVGAAPQHAVQKAEEFYNFVQGMVDIKPSQPQRN